jgi:O-antigen/teichoic acid export membrane protein
MSNKVTSRAAEVFRFLNRTDGSLRSKILRSGFWQASATIGVNGLTFLKSAILARLLAPEAFGLMSLALMIIRGAQLITETGFANALIQRKGDFDEAKDTAFTLLAIRGVVLAILMVPVSYGLAAFYDKPELQVLVSVCGLSFLFSGLTNINLTGTIKNLDFKKVAIVENAVAVTSFIVAMVMAVLLRSVWALVISFVAAAAMKSALSYVLISGRLTFKLDKAIALELLHYGKYITGSTVLLFFATEIDTATIGKLLDLEQLGYYSVAFMLANFPPTHVAFVLSNIMFPAYSKIQGEPELLRKTFGQVTNLVVSLVLPVMAGMAAASGPLIGAFYGEGWEAAVPPFRILCLFGALHAVVTVNGYMFNAIGRPDIGFRLAIVRLGGILILIVPAIKLGGLSGAASAMTLMMLATLGLGLRKVMQTLGMSAADTLRPILPGLLKSLVAAAVVLLVNLALPEQGRLKILWLILAAAAVYLPMNLDLVKMIFKAKK